MMSSVINEIEQQMQLHLSNDQMRQLHQVLESCLVKAEETNEQADLVQLFLAAKRVEGCSDKTIKYYDSTIRNAVEKINKEIEKHEDKKRKGGLGELIEECFFHYQCNSDSRPDFPEAGVELKVTPYKKGAKGDLVAKERLIITMIDYFKVIEEKFEDSHLWNKARLILLNKADLADERQTLKWKPRMREPAFSIFPPYPSY
mgnify:CR=1 FL=1